MYSWSPRGGSGHLGRSNISKAKVSNINFTDCYFGQK